MNSSLKDIFDFYKSNQISTKSMELEIARSIKNILPVTVTLDDSSLLGQTNSTYLAAIAPEMVNGIIKTNIVLDSNTIKNKLSSEDAANLVKLLEKHIHKSTKALNDFVVMQKGLEVSYLDCILIYLKIYLNFLLMNENNQIIKSLIDEKTIKKEDLNELVLAIETGNEGQEKVVEFILVNKLMPEFVLQKAEELFKRINSLSIETYSDSKYIDKPLENYWYSNIVAKITGTFNPETHVDLDPFYIPKSNLNK